jgi:hypothetical protein
MVVISSRWQCTAVRITSVTTLIDLTVPLVFFRRKSISVSTCLLVHLNSDQGNKGQLPLVQLVDDPFQYGTDQRGQDENVRFLKQF